MQQMRGDSFTAMPWKNGGGVTHEIVRDGDGDDFVWRISIADVNTSGPFSLYPRHRRVLCVIDGHGMALMGDKVTYDARRHCPISFEGSEALRGVLKDGPCRDFSLMYDPAHVEGSVAVLNGPATVLNGGKAGIRVGVYIISGVARCNQLTIAERDFVFLNDAADQLYLAAGAIAFHIVITPV
jgi:uncharacterized protein